ncbi:MAG: alginate lyase family protein [Ichthyobacteriaceae bacterium]|nr:alginate lyase family protein [Ichthyobacteriaceae bacterium]
MGLRYSAFRAKYTLESKLGLLKSKFPTNTNFKTFISLDEWRELKIPFFFDSKEKLSFNCNETVSEEKIEEMKKGVFTFFSSVKFNLGTNYNWITNPETNYEYDINKHWSEIADLSKEAGDIKYVWEKSRFSWLYTFIRYDLYSGIDQSEFVFSEIESFINNNPINKGPNYKCSQEISLRVLNWTFALRYFKNSKNLNDELFQKIMNHIYWQLHHVYNNIDFSRIAVRNNHAITETMTLFLSGILFPFIPDAEKWSYDGKKWFEQEVEYQIYEDGSFLQFSHNYHRVVVQLLTWAIKISELNQQKLSDVVYDRAKMTVEFLRNQQENTNGWLPNYGMNDGALFFPLNNNNYRNYKPQLQALANVLGLELYNKKFEDSRWYGDSGQVVCKVVNQQKNILEYDFGGFYGFRDDTNLTTIRCGTYKDRPAQADALNLDIWSNGVNIVFDPGTYKYNTNNEYLNFYHGTTGHNTITIGNNNQMVKGGRFIYYFWTKSFDRKVTETDSTFEFKGKISAFANLGKNIVHSRTVIKFKNALKWKIIDEISGYKGDLPIVQHWNILNEYLNDDRVLVQAFGFDGKALEKKYTKGWFSEKYGEKTEYQQLTFETNNRLIETNIEIVDFKTLR